MVDHCKELKTPFEIQGDHGTYPDYPYHTGTPTWNKARIGNTKLPIQVGVQSVISFDAATSIFSSNVPFEWLNDEPTGKKIDPNPSLTQSCYVVQNSATSYDFYIVISNVDANHPDLDDPDPFFAQIHLNSYPTGKTGILSVSFTVPETHASNFIDALVPSFDKNKKNEGVKKIGRPLPVLQNLFSVTLKEGNRLKETSEEELLRLFQGVSILEPVSEEIRKVNTDEVWKILGKDVKLDETEMNWLAIDAMNTPDQFRHNVLEFNSKSLVKLNQIREEKNPISIEQTITLEQHQWVSLGKLRSGAIYDIKCSISGGHPDLCLCRRAGNSDHGYPGSCNEPSHLYVCSSSIDKTRFKTPRGDIYAGIWSYSGKTTCQISITFVSNCEDFEGKVIKLN